MPVTAPVRITDVIALIHQLDGFNIPRNPRITRALDIWAALLKPEVYNAPTSLLDLTPAQVCAHARELAITRALGNDITNTGQGVIAEQLKAEMIHVLTDTIDTTLKAMRPGFDTATTAIHKATNLGITDSTTPAELITMDVKAITAYRDLRPHLDAINAIASIRIQMSIVLGLSPQRGTFEAGEIDYTPCFTHPDTGAASGLHSRTHPGRRLWLDLDRATNGQLNLNTPAQTTAIIREQRSLGTAPSSVDSGGVLIRPRLRADGGAVRTLLG